MEYANLVFSGSGTRWPLFIGAFKRLEQELHYYNIPIKNVLGTSGGSIAAACVGLGLSSEEIISLTENVMPSLSKMMDFSIWTLIQDYGFVKGKKIQALLEKHLPISLGECKIPTHIVVSNFDYERGEVFSSETHKDLAIARAIRMSISIPVLFTPALYNGDLYVDGGLYANFKVDHFGDIPNTFGFYIPSISSEIRRPRPKGIKSVALFISRIINMMIDSKTQDDIEDASHANIIPLNTKISSLDFEVNLDDVKTMILEGYIQTDKWIKDHQDVFKRGP